jgi:hypothetical protein
MAGTAEPISLLVTAGCYAIAGAILVLIKGSALTPRPPLEVPPPRTPLLSSGAVPLDRSRPPGRLGRDQGVARGRRRPPHKWKT